MQTQDSYIKICWCKMLKFANWILIYMSIILSYFNVWLTISKSFPRRSREPRRWNRFVTNSENRVIFSIFPIDCLNQDITIRTIQAVCPPFYVKHVTVHVFKRLWLVNVIRNCSSYFILWTTCECSFYKPLKNSAECVPHMVTTVQTYYVEAYLERELFDIHLFNNFTEGRKIQKL